MLYLIIMIVGERFSPGIGQVNATDEIKREIIHQLSIRPMAHSELVKALPEDENRETGMESVIEEVACFKKPGLTGRGLYELKPECTKNFNLYFYHFSRAEQSKAEEAQRKLKRQNREDTGIFLRRGEEREASVKLCIALNNTSWISQILVGL